jgi:putative ABC transport system permease protein
MSFSLATLWYERQRFLPGVLAVAFSALLIALQCGLLLGMFSITSLAVDVASADIWVGGPRILSIDQGQAIPEPYLARLASQPEVERCEIYLKGFAFWERPTDGGAEMCMIIGSQLEDNALGAARNLTPAQRILLSEPGAVIVDRSELGRLGAGGVGEFAEINGLRVRIIDLVEGLQSIAAPYIFCSLGTARQLLQLPPGQTTYLLAQCDDPAHAPAVVERLRAYPDMSAFTSAELTRHTRMHWMTRTKAGLALGLAAALGLLVGGMVTSQTLYAATTASLREYAVLEALGIPGWRMAGAVMSQALWVGVAGIALALPAAFALAHAANALGARVDLPLWLLSSAAGLTLVMALLSGLLALRSLRSAEPAILLR